MNVVTMYMNAYSSKKLSIKQDGKLKSKRKRRREIPEDKARTQFAIWCI